MAGAMCNFNRHQRLLNRLNNSINQWLHGGKQCVSPDRCHRTFFKVDYSYFKSSGKGIPVDSQPKVKKLDQKHEDRLRYVQLEYEIWKAEGVFEVPHMMNDSNWMKILSCRGEADRLYVYGEIKQNQELWMKKRLQQDKQRHEDDKIYNQISHKVLQDGCSVYLNKELFRYKTQMQEKANEMRGWEFGRPVVFDFSGEKYQPLIMKSLTQILKMNQYHPEPCCIHYTGCGTLLGNTHSDKDILRHFHDFTFLQRHEETLPAVFPKDKLVIVTNTSSNLLEDSSTDIPVFMMNKTRGDILQFAEDHNIKHAFLPLHRYIKVPWHHRKFNFTLPQTVQVLLDVNFTHNWVDALLKNIPEHVARHCHSVKDVVQYIQTTKGRHTQHRLKKIW